MKCVSIKTRLYILVLVVLVPLVILQAVGIVYKYKHSIDMELNANEDFAGAISFAFTNYLESIWDSEYAIGLAITSHPQIDVDEIEAYMRDVASSQPSVLRYSWLTADGIVIASTSKEGRGKYLCDREYVRRINDGEEKVLTGLVEARLDHGIAVPVARGIWKDGRFMGIIVAALDDNMIEDVLPRQRIGRTSVFGLIDQNGMLVYHSRNNDIPFNERKIKDSSPAWKAFSGQTIRAENHGESIDSDSRMGVYMPIGDTGWVCFSSIAVDEALEKSWQEIRRNVWFLFFVVVTSLAGVRFVSKSFVDSITTLERAAQNILNGDLTVRTNIEGEDELAKAGKAFDKMACHIEELEENRRLFLQTSAHELRNPMAGIKGITSLIKRRADSGKPLEGSLQAIELLEKEVDRLSRLLNQILEAFRAQTGKPKLKSRFKPINIIDIVVAALKPFQIEEGSHEFIFNPEDRRSLWVMGDPERLTDVLVNLFKNAVKYSPEGSRVSVSIGADDAYVTISVRDEGIGIPEDQINRVFESFYRGDNFKDTDPGGMGLGLYICRDTVINHGGFIWVENNIDRGCTFYVRLPLLKDIKDHNEYK